MHVAIVDHLFQVVATDNESSGELLPVDPVNVTLSGVTKATAVNGVFTFTDFRVSAEPGTDVELYVSTAAVDTSKAEKAADSTTYNSSVVVDVDLRLCDIGEALVGKDCFLCLPNTYTLEAGGTCEDCPTEAICYGNWTMVPRSGYWRDNKHTDKFFVCPNIDACIGSPTPPDNLSYTGDCAVGYKGNMCQACDKGYSRGSKNKCGACPDPTMNVIRLNGIFIAVVVFMCILIRSVKNSALQPAKLHSVYLKIFMNYL